MLEQIQEIWNKSDLAQGGILVLLSGSIMGIIWKCWYKIIFILRKIFFAEVNAIQFSSPFNHILKFVENTTYNKKQCSDYIAKDNCNETLLTPYYGIHYFFHKWRFYRFYLSVEQGQLYRYERIGIRTFKIFGKAKIIKRILEIGEKLYKEEKYENTHIFIPQGEGWHLSNKKKLVKPPILDKIHSYQKLEANIKKFIDSEKEYEEKQLNYRKGYLFHGQPGNGKSMCILALAQSVKKNLCILSLGDTELTESKLLMLISNMPKNTALCLEDVDTAQVSENREQDANASEKKTKKNISLGVILNIIDGPHTPDGLIVFMTTNHISKLDEALIRPGRIDVKYEFTNTNEFQANELFNRLVSSNGHPERKNFINKVIDKPIAEAYIEAQSII